MRPRALVALLFATGCAVRSQPYRFASPMIGGADVPPPMLGRLEPRVGESAPAPRRRPPEGLPVEARTSTGPAIRIASAEAAEAVVHEANAHGLVWSRLPSPHRMPAEAPHPALREPADLRVLVGRRDKRDSATAAIAWARELDRHVDDAASGPELVARASAGSTLAGSTDAAEPGDLLVFDRTDSDTAGDLVAIAIARDARGVTELIYVAGGVVRRGFLDPAHPAQRRDHAGVVLNTFMRAGKRWPPKGTHYLAGELLAHVIRTR